MITIPDVQGTVSRSRLPGCSEGGNVTRSTADGSSSRPLPADPAR